MTVVRLACGFALIVALGGCFDGSSHDSDSDSDTSTTPSNPVDSSPDTPAPAQCATMHCAPAP